MKATPIFITSAAFSCAGLQVEVEMLRDAALGWIRANVGDERFCRDFQRHFDTAANHGLNCYLALGPGLTYRGSPQLLHCFCDELFIFELTPLQARAYNLGARQVMWGTCLGKSEKPNAVEPFVTISNLEIQRAASLPVNHPIIADIAFDAGGHEIGPCVVRLDYEIPGVRNTVAWHYVDQILPISGRIRCRYLPLNHPAIPETMPLAMFFRLCRLSDPMNTENRKPISNTVAGLVCLSNGF